MKDTRKDKIKGGEKDDYIFGYNGSDQLRGEVENDEIDGVLGSAIFIWGSSKNTISDFNITQKRYNSKKWLWKYK